MNPNEKSSTVCPECSVRFHVDPNGGFLQFCPTCGTLVDLSREGSQ